MMVLEIDLREMFQKWLGSFGLIERDYCSIVCSTATHNPPLALVGRVSRRIV